MSGSGGTSRIIALMNQKGGVGKTTTAVNLGAALAERGRRVLLIDLDPQAHLTLHVGLDPAQLDASVYDLLIDDSVEAASVIRRAPGAEADADADADRRVDVLPAEVDLAGAEPELAGRPARQSILSRKLAPVAADYDFVLLDCPPSLGLLTINALAAATEVIVPMQPHFLALQGLSKLLETVQLVRQSVNRTLRVSGVVLAMHEPQTNLANEVVADLEAFFHAARPFAMPWSGAVIYRPPIRRNIKLAECPSFGRTVLDYAPTCAGAADYRRLAAAVMNPSAMDSAVFSNGERTDPAHGNGDGGVGGTSDQTPLAPPPVAGAEACPTGQAPAAPGPTDEPGEQPG